MADSSSEPEVERRASRGGRLRGRRAPFVFGIIAATLEMGVILWFMYCA